MGTGYVDCDGHVMERVDEIAELIGRRNGIEGEINPRRMVPSLDRFHTPRLARRTPGTFDPTIGPERWMEFLEKTGLEYSVLFPTEGLAYGQISFAPWANAYAKGYNDWLYEKYLRFSPKLKGVALIPMQDVPSAVAELKRAVKELGMLGAMLPSNGLKHHLGAKEYWPIYQEAEKLDCALAVHGGCYGDLGFNSFDIFPATRALGMPFPLAIAATGMMVDGVFDTFPTLRVGFLEGGTAWIPLVIDRLEREMEYGGLHIEKKPEEYFMSGRIFVG
jgi:predicted TIM-barrel fold metal-dependent hydrolase